jgi:3-deoxy-D-manno-octulosonic-acid transferase
MTDLGVDALLGIYRAAGFAAMPVLPAFLNMRASRGKEDRARMGERFGRSVEPRAPGKLVWVHAASVGETNAVLPLIGRMVSRGVSVVLTTVTVSSARIAAARLPKGAIHQFAPVDVAPVLGRFLAHWRPSLAVFVESEQWPATIQKLDAAGIPRVLVNARLSDRSFRRWQRVGRLANALFGRTTLCLAQSDRDARRYAALGMANTVVSGNLKFDVPPPDADPAEVAAFHAAIAGRPVWLAASTHDGEEAIVAAAHRIVAARHPDLLTLLVPRHPERGEPVATMLRAEGLSVARRTAGEPLAPSTAIYLADTVGELGLFYRLAPVAFMGGSLISRGGQNPIEPAGLETVVLHGPHVHNFADIYEALDRSGQASVVHGPDELASEVAALLADPAEARRRAAIAAPTLRAFAGALDATMIALDPWLAPSSPVLERA